MKTAENNASWFDAIITTIAFGGNSWREDEERQRATAENLDKKRTQLIQSGNITADQIEKLQAQDYLPYPSLAYGNGKVFVDEVKSQVSTEFKFWTFWLPIILLVGFFLYAFRPQFINK